MSSKDTRIVELQFDNKTFEDGVQTTLKTLEKLDKHLDTVDGKSLEGLQKSIEGVSFKGMENGIEALNEKFSALGTMTRRIFENIADDIYNLGKKVVSSTIGQVFTGGSARSQNIEQAKFMFQGLGLDIEEAMANANAAVTDTAYGLDEAAVVASQLAASGVKLGDDMTKALTAISGAAAMTGSNYVDLGRIFTTVAGNGRLMGDQLIQFSTRGLNIASDIAEAYGMTESEVRQAVSDGAITFDMFYETLYNKYAAQAKRANETFNGALSNVKAALSRIGAEIMTPFYTAARDVLNAVRPYINSVKTALTPVFDFLKGRMEYIAQNVQLFFGDMFEQVWQADEKLEEGGKYVTQLKEGPAADLAKVADILQNVFQGVWNVALRVVDIFKAISNGFKDVFGSEIVDKILELSKSFAEFAKPVYDTSKGVGELAEGISEFNERTRVVPEWIDYIRNAAAGLFSIFKFGVQILKNIWATIGPIFHNVILPVGNWIMQVGLWIFSEIGKRLSKLTELFSKFTGIQVFGKTLGEVLGNAKDKINSFTDLTIEKLNWLSSKLDKLPDFLKEIWASVKNFASNTFGGVVKFFSDFGESINKLKENVGDSAFIQGLKTIFGKLKEFFDNLTFSDVAEKFVNAFTNIRNTLADAYEFLKPVIGGLYELLTHLATTIKETFVGSLSGEAGGNLLSGGILATSVLLLKNLKDTGGKVVDFLEKGSLRKNLFGLIGELGNTLKSFQKSINADNLKKLAEAIAIMAASIAVLTLIDTKKATQVAGILMMVGAGLGFFLKIMTERQTALEGTKTFEDAAHNLSQGINSFLSSMAKALKRAITIDSIMLAVDMLALAILTIAGAIKMISSIDSDKLGQSLGVVAGAIVTMVGAFMLIYKLADQLKTSEMTKLLATAGAFAIVVKSLSQSLLGIATGLAVFALAYEGHKEGFIVGSVALVGIIATLSYVIQMFSSSKIEAQVGKLFAIAGVFTILAGNLTIIAVGLAALGGAFAIIGAVPWYALLEGVAVMGLVVGGITSAASRLGYGGGGAAILLSTAVLSISASLYVLVGAIGLLGLISWESLAKFAVILLAFGAAVAGFAILVDKFSHSFIDFGKGVMFFGVGVLAFGAGITLLVASVAAMAALAPVVKVAAQAMAEGLTEFVIALANSGPEMDKAVQNLITRFLENLISTVTRLLGPTVETIGALAVKALDALQKHVPDIVTKLSNLIVTALKSLTDKVPELVDAVFDFLDALIGAVGKRIDHTFSGINFVSVTAFAVAFGFIIKWFGSMKQAAKDALPVVGVIGLLLAELVAAFAVMDALDAGNTIASAAGLSAIVLSVGSMLALLAKFNVTITAAVKTALAISVAFDIIVVVIGGLVLGIGALANEWEGMLPAIQKGAEVMQAIGDAIGKFIGAIAGGIIEGVGIGIEALGQSLTNFWNNASGFFTGIKSLDESVLQNAQTLASTILVLSTSNLLNAVAEFLGASPNFESLGTCLSSFGRAMIEFSDSIAELDDTALTRLALAAPAAESLAKVAEYAPKEGGLWQKIVGTSDIGAFGQSIVTFGTCLVSFANTITAEGGIDDAKITAINKAVEAAKGIAEFNDAVPLSGGLWQDIAGGKSLSSWSLDLMDFGNCMVILGHTLQNLTPEHVEGIKRAVEGAAGIAEFNDKIPTSGGAWQDIAGSKSLRSWSLDLMDFGNCILVLGDTVQHLTDEHVQGIKRAVEGASAISEFANTLQIDGGAWQDIFGSKSLNVMSDGFREFGEGIRLFSESLSGADLSSVAGGAQALQILLPLSKLLADNSDAFAGNISLGFSQTLYGMGNGLAKFVETTAEVDYTKVDEGIAYINKFIKLLESINTKIGRAGKAFKESLEDLASTNVNAFADAFQANYDEVAGKVRQFFESLIKFIKNFGSNYKEVGSSLAKKLIEGFSKGSQSAKSTIQTFVTAMLNVLNNAGDKFQRKGGNNIAAYLKGMTSKTNDIKRSLDSLATASVDALTVYNEMYSKGGDAIAGFVKGATDAANNTVGLTFWNIGRLALKSAKEALDSNSPSKEFMKVGEDSDMGLIIGAKNFAKKVAKQGYQIGHDFLDSVENGLADLSSLLEENKSNEIVLTPVFDMSQVQNGFGNLSDIFSVGSMNVSPLGTISYGVQQKIYNDSNVVKAIERLDARMDDVTRRMENMQIVLDDRTLIGKMAPGINEELGSIQRKVERGILS